MTDPDRLETVLRGADAVIDVLNTDELDAAKAVAYFESTTRALWEAEERLGIGHHVTLSIVNVDAVHDNGHDEGKQTQEAAVSAGATPWSILCATQFFDFPAIVVAWTASEGVAPSRRCSSSRWRSATLPRRW